MGIEFVKKGEKIKRATVITSSTHGRARSESSDPGVASTGVIGPALLGF